MSFVVVMVLLLVVMYVLMIRRQRQAQQQAMIDGAGVGDDILTTGGIYGTITEADGDDMVVELGEGLTVHMTRRAIAAVLPPEAEPLEDELGDEYEERAQEDDSPAEASLTHEEEAVRDDGAGDELTGTPR